MMYDRARRESDRAAARHDPREQLGVLARNGIVANYAEVFAKISEALECGTSESDVGAEIVYKMLGGRRRRRGDRALVVHRELDPEAWAEPFGRRGGPSRE